MREWLRLHPNRFKSLSKYWKNDHPCWPFFCNNNYLLLLLLPSNLLHFVFPATLSWVCRFLQTDVRRKIVELEAKIKMPLESSHSSPAYNCFNLIQPISYGLFTYCVRQSSPLPSSSVKHFNMISWGPPILRRKVNMIMGFLGICTKLNGNLGFRKRPLNPPGNIWLPPLLHFSPELPPPTWLK